MTREQVAMVQESFEKVAPIADTVADLFYDRLFVIDPDVRGMFPVDPREQKKKLIGILGIAVSNLHQLDTIIPAVEALAKSAKPGSPGTTGELSMRQSARITADRIGARRFSGAAASSA